MKHILTSLFFILVNTVSFGQGEQLYPDGSDVDQDGNTFEWINYGTQDWSIENAEVVTYRDGTPIPQVTSDAEWSNLATGAWAYYNNDPTKRRLYNWYALAGIHDAASFSDPSLRKEFAPQGWQVPSDPEWTILEEYLIANGYNYDGTTTGNKIAKSMASTSGWGISTVEGAVGNDQSLNNSSGFNAFPDGIRINDGSFLVEGNNAVIWSSTENDLGTAWYRNIGINRSWVIRPNNTKQLGLSVRFFRNNSTASLDDFTNSINIFPNPASDFINITVDSELEVLVLDLLGKELIRENINGKLDISFLEKGIYIIKLTDGVNTSSYKIIKK